MGGKLFSPKSQRISTKEMDDIFVFLKEEIGDLFLNFQLVEFLKSKKDHGDIDILCFPKNGNWTQDINKKLSDIIEDNSTNDNVHSYLMRFDGINKMVHVDFIATIDKDKFKSLSDYYILNDFSAIIGILSRKYNFLYSERGFFKKFKDKKGNYKKILITNDLMKGLKIMGYFPSKIKEIESLDDIIKYVTTSSLFDYRFFDVRDLNAHRRKDYKNRENINYMINELQKIKKTSKIKDKNYFLKKLYPTDYQKMIDAMKKINSESYIRNKYNGQWVMDTFNISPGPYVGKILKIISNKFGKNIHDVHETDIINYIQGKIK